MNYWPLIGSLFRTIACISIVSAFMPAAAHSAQITLGWDSPEDSRVTGYRIYYGVSGTEFQNTPRMTVEPAGQTTAVISSLEPGKTYQFAMTSIDGQGNESAFSEEISHAVPADSDGDGVTDGADLCPNDPDKTAPGDCGCGVPDTDSDGDGVPDCLDNCPNDPNKIDPESCGCGIADTDTDADGSADCIDSDDDGDGMPDDWEVAHGLDPLYNDAANDLDGDGVSNLEEYRSGTDPSQILENLAPEAPILIAPQDNAVDMNRKISLEAGAFFDPDNDGHGATEWQISTRSDFSELVLRNKTDKKLTKLPVTHVVFAENQTYYWRACYFDDRGARSEWSAVNTFTTGIWGRDKNNNGISDTSESLLATDLDSNGISDSEQADIKSIQVVTDSEKQVAVQYAANEAIEYIEGVDPLTIDDQSGMPESVPFGLINFKIKVEEPGQIVVVTVHLSEPAPDGARWYKYDDSNGWQDYSSRASFSPDRTSVDLLLQDGGFGDADGVANGIIVDPSGVGANAGSDGGGGGGSCFINTLY